MTRRSRKRQRVYAHVLNEMAVGETKNSRDLIDSWNEQNFDSINGNSFGQIMRGLMASGHVHRDMEWIAGRKHDDSAFGVVRSKGSWETVYTRLK